MEAQTTSYVIERDEDGCTLNRLTTGPRGVTLTPVPIRHDLRRHSAGFEFGYAGSGPAQTALAILADCAGDEKAQDLYQKFKRTFLASADGDYLRIGRTAVELWVAEQYRIPPDSLSDWASRT